ncbi:ankyrin repeat-containing domain protein [Gaertneriomyces semiglobifer]|nr:ankyrin repeat-containing domain protein [Gaertneriomyces semiglobifer]
MLGSLLRKTAKQAEPFAKRETDFCDLQLPPDVRVHLSAEDKGYAASFAFARHQLDAARLLLRDQNAEIARVEDALYCVATATDPGWVSMLEPNCLQEQALLAVLCTALSARPPFLTLHDAFLKYDLAEIIIMRDLHSCLRFLCAQPSFEVCYDNNWLLRLACARGSLLCTKVLLQHGADPSVAGGLILRDCAAAGNENVLELLLNATTPLAAPSQKLYINIASVPREALNSSLISAVQNNHPRVALLLLRHGADVGAGDEMPIRIAIARGYVNLVELLVAAGADICRVLGVGKSVMDVVASGWITRWDKWSR